MKKSHSRGQHSSYSQALQVDGGDSDILHSHTHTLTHMHLDMADTHNCVHSSSASSELMEEGMGLDREVEDSEAHGECASVCVCVYVCVCVCVCMYVVCLMCVRACACMYVCMYACMHSHYVMSCDVM